MGGSFNRPRVMNFEEHRMLVPQSSWKRRQGRKPALRHAPANRDHPLAVRRSAITKAAKPEDGETPFGPGNTQFHILGRIHR